MLTMTLKTEAVSSRLWMTWSQVRVEKIGDYYHHQQRRRHRGNRIDGCMVDYKDKVNARQSNFELKLSARL